MVPEHKLVVNNVQNTVQPQRRMYPAQYYQNMYANQAFSGGDDTFMGLGPIGGGGIFSNMNGMYGGGMMGGMYGMYGMYGFGPGSELRNMSQADYLKYQEDMENFQMERGVRQKLLGKAADFKANSGEDNVTREIMILHDKIVNNDQEHIVEQRNRLRETVRESLERNNIPTKDMSDAQLESYAEKLYYSKIGASVYESLEQHGDSSFGYGMKKGALFNLGSLITNKQSADETKAQLTNTPLTKKEKNTEIAGQATSWLLSGLALIGTVLLARKGVNARSAARTEAKAFSALEKEAKGLGIKVKESYTLEELQKKINKFHKKVQQPEFVI